MTTIVESQSSAADLFSGATGAGTEVVVSIDALRRHLDERPDEFAVVLGPSVNLEAAVKLAETLRVSRPALSVILVRPRVDSSVLGDALHSGMREVVEQRDLTALSQAVARGRSLYHALTADRPGDADDVKGRLVTVFSAKGGVGKTTVATNLAVALSGMQMRVCLVDLDLAFGDVGITLQLPVKHSIADVPTSLERLDPKDLEPLLATYSDTLSALLAPSSAEPNDGGVRAIVGAILATLKQSFDYVVVDTPPAFEDHVLQAFDESDLLFLVLTPDITALKNLKLTMQMLDLLNYPGTESRIVLNRADSSVGLSGADVERTLKGKIFASIPSSQEVPLSINQGKPIVTATPEHPVSRAFRRMARDCIAQIPNAAARTATPSEPAVSGKPRRFPWRARNS